MRLRPVAAAIVALTATALLAGCGGEAKTAAAPPPPPNVEVTPVAFKELRQWADVTGHLEAIDSVGIRPRVGGFIDEVRRKGQKSGRATCSSRSTRGPSRPRSTG
jgi:membrane fusion protein, multidrug efflux system